ncbi:MAG: histone deacetylase family protein [Promethearchaeota archaeon]
MLFFLDFYVRGFILYKKLVHFKFADPLSRSVKRRLGVLTHEIFTIGDPIVPKPYFEAFESPDRISHVLAYWDRIRVGEYGIQFVNDSPPASKTDVLRVHSHFLYEKVERLTEAGSGEVGNSVLASSLTLNLARQAAGCCIAGLRAVLGGKYDGALCLVRPPGHHATRTVADGLCVFNNIAIAIEAARHAHLASRFAIVDLDAHYGDGLASIYYDDPSVLYFSLHEVDFSQGEGGSPRERGTGKGKGFTLNLPVPVGTTGPQYLDAFEFVPPVLREFDPDVVIVAAGLDGHYADPIGNLKLTSRTYRRVGEILSRVARESSNNKILYCLEGGYNTVALPPSLTALFCPEAYDANPFSAENSEIEPVDGTAKLLTGVEEQFRAIHGAKWGI